MLIVADKLGKFVSEVAQLSPQELAAHVAFYKLQRQEHEKDAKKRKAQNKK